MAARVGAGTIVTWIVPLAELGVTARDVAVGAEAGGAAVAVGRAGTTVAVGKATGALVGVDTTIVTPIGRDVAVGRGGGGADVAVAARAGGCVGAGRGGAGAWVATGRRMAVVAVGGATVAVAVVGPFVGVIVAVPIWLGVGVKSAMDAAVAVWGTSVGRTVGVVDGVVRADWPFGPGPTVAAMTYIEVANRNMTTAMTNAAAAVLLRLSYHPQPW